MLFTQQLQSQPCPLRKTRGTPIPGRTLATILLAGLLPPLMALAQTAPQIRTAEISAAVNPEAVELARAANGALGKRDYDTAIKDLTQAAHLAPDVAEFQANLGTAYYRAGRPQDAIAPCRQALKLKPSLTFARYFLELSLAETGECKPALPMLEKDYETVRDSQIRRFMGLDGGRCTMAVGDPLKATDWLEWLNRDFPDDPDVLYLSTRIFSDLSTLSSQRLLRVAPGSYQAHQIDADVLEIQGRNSEAIAEYRKVADAAPGVPGVHYHIGRLLLAGGPDPATEEAARKEFEKELQIDPNDAASEYELGEMARAARQWTEAAEHFQRAAKIDPGFSDALIGLGKSLVSAGQPDAAVGPLEEAVRLAPADPVAHYQLSFAYLRLGREEEAKKELALYRQAQDRRHQMNLAIRRGMTGGISKAQTADPPE
ncbi:MAG: tetratricopeptide repeat protein [Terriglobia bacterium]